jgi:peroxiredoxin
MNCLSIDFNIFAVQNFKEFKLNIMNRLFGIVLMIMISGCSNPSGYNIQIALQGAKGKIFLEKYENGTFTPKDTAEFKNGVAVFKGKVDFPEMYILHIEGQEQRAVLFVENMNFKVSGNADSIQSIKITGSPVNDEYLSIKSVLDNDNRIAMVKYQEFQMAAQNNDTVNAIRLQKELQNLNNATLKKLTDFVKTNTASWVTPLFLEELQSIIEPEEMDSILNQLDPKLAVVPSVKAVKERLEKVRKVATGQIAPDFTQNNPEGKPVTLSAVYAKNAYTLIDFWASWCRPCREENPNVVAVYNDFKNKGFSVFGVSLDQDHDRWVQAIESDKLTWDHVSDLKYWQNEAAGLYSVSSIPANFLVDKSGKIVAKNLRGEDLRKKLEELLP